MTNEEFQESLIWALKTLLAASYVNIFCPTSRGSADLGPAPDASVLAVSGEKGRLFDLFLAVEENVDFWTYFGHFPGILGKL